MNYSSEIGRLVDKLHHNPELAAAKPKTTTLSFRVPISMTNEMTRYAEYFGMSRAKLCQQLMEAAWSEFWMHLDIQDHETFTMISELARFDTEEMEAEA